MDTSGTTGEQFAAATWLRLSGSVLRGLTHSLGNRVHSTEMMLSSMAVGDTLTDEIMTFLANESAQSADLVRLYRLLNFAPNGASEACRVADSVPDALTLWRSHADRGSEEWTMRIHEDVAAALVSPIALTQALLLLMLAHQDDSCDPNGALSLEVRPDNEWIVVELRSTSTSDAEIDDARKSAAWMLRAARATVAGSSDPGAGTTTVLRLPSLAHARALEKAERNSA